MKSNFFTVHTLSKLLLASSLLLTGTSHANEHQQEALKDNHAIKTTITPTHGAIAGDVKAHSAIIWARGSNSSLMHVFVNKHNNKKIIHKTIEVNASHDFTGKIKIDRLADDTNYDYSVWFSPKQNNLDDLEQDIESTGKKLRGSFHTAPSKNKARALSFAWGGDLAGQNVCRDSQQGFPIFNAISQMNLDFFIGLGDMIYADGTCTQQGKYGNQQVIGNYDKSSNLTTYWAHWKYNLADKSYQNLLSNTAYYAIWDDHEVVNDFGPLHDTRSSAPYTAGQHLLPMGLQSFLDYNPVDESPDQPKRLYRTIRWGKHFELFVLDTRQYRDSNIEADDKSLKKTMLGREQLAWLKEKLKASDATWKMIVSSVPISIPTGYPADKGRDGWSGYDQLTGFEQELKDLFLFMRKEGINNSVWVTTDVHFAEVFRYTPFSDTPDFKVHEFVTGPLNAGLYPNRDFDTSWGTESLFFYGPQSMSSTKTYEQAKKWMNYGAVNIDENGIMNISVRDINGGVLYQQTMYPE